jgi:hypothetical protein
VGSSRQQPERYFPPWQAKKTQTRKGVFRVWVERSGDQETDYSKKKKDFRLGGGGVFSSTRRSYICRRRNPRKSAFLPSRKRLFLHSYYYLLPPTRTTQWKGLMENLTFSLSIEVERIDPNRTTDAYIHTPFRSLFFFFFLKANPKIKQQHLCYFSIKRERFDHLTLDQAQTPPSLSDLHTRILAYLYTSITTQNIFY